MTKPTDAGSRMIVVDGYTLDCLRPSTKAMLIVAELETTIDMAEKVRKLDTLWPKLFGFCTNGTSKKIPLEDVPMEVLLNGLSEHPSFRS